MVYRRQQVKIDKCVVTEIFTSVYKCACACACACACRLRLRLRLQMYVSALRQAKKVYLNDIKVIQLLTPQRFEFIVNKKARARARARIRMCACVCTCVPGSLGTSRREVSVPFASRCRCSTFTIDICSPQITATNKTETKSSTSLTAEQQRTEGLPLPPPQRPTRV